MKAKNLMFQGTASSAGKSLIASAVCRVAAQDGLKVAPFKSQNMALNSFVTPEGGEMGRAQVTQAECAGVAPSVDMNPILLKPNSDMGSQVIVDGKVWGNLRAVDYYANKKEFLNHALEAYDRLSQEYDLIVVEGAGSPAEINLKDNDIVNMGLAREISAPVVIVCDIDRGGMFASLYGTVLLQDEPDRELIKGFIVNKFRGDVEILKPGLAMIEEMTGVPCLGVLPYLDLDIDDEDSLTERFHAVSDSGGVTVGVIRLKHISNISDFTAFGSHDGVSVKYYSSPEELLSERPDILIIPGTKNVMEDMAWLKGTGLAEAVVEFAESGTVIGVCGGFQMMGNLISDPSGVESESGSVAGLGIIDAETVLEPAKTTVQAEGTAFDGSPVSGYEIHMGSTELPEGLEPFAVLSDGRADGVCLDGGRVIGTYLHGVFDSDQFRRGLLERAGFSGAATAFREYKERQYDRLAEAAREYLDIGRLYEIAGITEGQNAN